MIQNDKKIYPLRLVTQEPYIMWLSFMGHMCEIFPVFQKKFFFWVVMRIKEQKTVQNNKKFCPSCSILQELYTIWFIWFSFIVQICKMIISPDVFFNFKILIFWVFTGLKGQEMSRNEKNLCLSQELYIIFIYGIRVHMYAQKDNTSSYFFILFFLVFNFWDH